MTDARRFKSALRNSAGRLLRLIIESRIRTTAVVRVESYGITSGARNLARMYSVAADETHSRSKEVKDSIHINLAEVGSCVIELSYPTDLGLEEQ